MLWKLVVVVYYIERVAAPTYASMVRSCRRGSAPACLSLEVEETHICERHARRQAAATAISAAACTCDGRHRHQIRQRRASVEVPRPNELMPQNSACRQPFPLVVHDLRLKPMTPHHKIIA